MLDGLMIAYQKVRHGLVETFSGTEGVSYRETRFYDLGFMQTQLYHVQKELKGVEESLSNSIKNENNTDEVNQYRKELARRREFLIFHMIFILSNSFSNLDNCRKLSKGHDFSFMSCVEGLSEYKKGNHQTAYELLDGYCKENGDVEDHFLVNKVYGLLCFEKQNYNQAISSLSYALSFMPDDVEALKTLNICYQMIGGKTQQGILSEICDLLSF